MDALSPSRSSSRKRSSPSPLSAAEHVVDVDGLAGDDQPPAKKKRAPRSTAAEKHQRKVARMERNRVAAQVSRDRRKLQTEFLEARVAELEAQLVGGPATASSTSPSTLPRTPASFPALPALPALPDPRTAQLEEENEALKTQLALEKLQSQSLQIRLSALESKFNRLEQLLVQAHTRGRPFPAAEAVPPVVPSPSSLVDDVDSLLGLQLDLAPAAAPVAAPDPLFYPDLSAPILGDDVVAQAWADWATQVDLTPAPPSFAAHDLAPPVDGEFDLFEYLRQDAAAAGPAAAAVC
ncbi:bZIP transcription factor [Rhodotorula paludigena]|uniref:bZIP transcription factor n=1 Tax=Rhodotorula paludigena TaxID=86838 RepID=UPI00317412D5